MITVVVTIEDGLTQSVEASDPAAVRVIIIDKDVDGTDDDRVATVGGEDMFITDYQVDKLSVEASAAITYLENEGG